MATIRVRLPSGQKVDLGPNEQVVVWRRGAGAPPVTLHSSRVDEQDKRHPINWFICGSPQLQVVRRD